jgi:hypothetical protein
MKGKPVVVENKPGAGAMLAATDVLSHARDGYDLLLCTYFDAVNTLLYKSAKYRLSDILGISLIANAGDGDTLQGLTRNPSGNRCRSKSSLYLATARGHAGV